MTIIWHFQYSKLTPYQSAPVLPKIDYRPFLCLLLQTVGCNDILKVSRNFRLDHCCQYKSLVMDSSVNDDSHISASLYLQPPCNYHHCCDCSHAIRLSGTSINHHCVGHWPTIMTQFWNMSIEFPARGSYIVNI